VTGKIIIFIEWIPPQSIRKLVMDTQKDAYMQEHSKQVKVNVPPMPNTGKVDMDAVRLGLAMVMDGLRALSVAGVQVSRSTPMISGAMLLPVILLHDHIFSVMDKGKMFTIDGVSVMEGHGEAK
jgi:hypothetical protein